MCTRKQATIALRELVQQQWVNPAEYALYSRRIGGAPRLASGFAPVTIGREGRWKSDAVMVCVHNNKEDTVKALTVIATEINEGEREPGQGTAWRSDRRG